METSIRLCFAFFLLVLIAAGITILKNWDKLFGPHPDLKHESSGGATYSKAQFIVVWVIAIKALLIGIFHGG